MAARSTKDALAPRVPWALVGAITLFAVIVIAGAAAFYRDQELNLRHEAQQRVSAVADLKAEEVRRWRESLEAALGIFHDNPAFARVVDRVLDDPEDTAAVTELNDWLKGVQAHPSFDGVYLLDREGIVSGVVEGATEVDESHVMSITGDLIAAGEVIFVDLHRDEQDGHIHLMLVVPVGDPEPQADPVGALVLTIDPEVYLYPYLMEWPVPSETAETLLVRRDGDDMLFLNDLRFRENAALDYRIPLSESDVAAVRAVLGEQGLVEGPDYRGKQVVSALHAIPDSPWFLVTKMDAEEAYARLRDRLLLTIVLGASFVVTVVGASALVWRHQRVAHFRERYRAELDRAWLRDIVERSLNEVYTFDPETLRYSFVNDGAARNLGYRPDELLGMTALDVKPLMNEESLRERVAPLLSGEREVIVLETLHERRDGSRYPVEIHLQLVDSARGPVFLTIGIDITERQEAQRALTESEERFRAIFEQTDQGIAMGTPDRRIELYNDAMERISGYTRADVQERGWFELVFPDEEMRAEAIRLATAALQGDSPYVELPIVRKDGNERWVSFATMPVTVAGETFILLVVTDITDRKIADERLRESEGRFRLMAESIPGAVYLCRKDDEWSMIYFNSEMERLTGVPADEMLEGTTSYASVCHPDDLHRIQEDIERAVEAGLSFHLVYRIERPDGEERWVEEFGGALHPSGERHLLEGVIFDITERKAAEEELEQHRKHLEELVEQRTREIAAINDELDASNEELQSLNEELESSNDEMQCANAELETTLEELARVNEELENATLAKSRFLANMSHELRTPLNSIIGFSGVVAQGLAGPLTEEQETQVGMIYSSGKHLLELINDVLDLSKVEAGGTELRCESVDVAELAREVADVLSPLAAEKGLDLSLQGTEDETGVYSDCGMIRQVLTNLAGNAVKFTEEGSVTITIDGAEDGGVLVSVADTGPGIAADQLEHVFGTFTQIELPDAVKPKGTGLGLALSREYAHLLGGEITVRSEVGVGSTFTLVLPPTLPGRDE